MKARYALAVAATMSLFGQTTTKEPPAPAPAITAPTAPRIYVNVPAIRQANGTYTIHSTIKLVKALCVYRNGMRMAPGVDYTYVSATGIIFPKFPWAATDIVLLDFQIG